MREVLTQSPQQCLPTRRQDAEFGRRICRRRVLLGWVNNYEGLLQENNEEGRGESGRASTTVGLARGCRTGGGIVNTPT